RQFPGGAAPCTDPFAPAPLQRPHRSYGSVRPSAPPRYSRLAVFAAWASPLPSERLVPAVPRESLCWRHAPYTPVAACPVIRLPAAWSEAIATPLGLTEGMWSRT